MVKTRSAFFPSVVANYSCIYFFLPRLLSEKYVLLRFIAEIFGINQISAPYLAKNYDGGLSQVFFLYPQFKNFFVNVFISQQTPICFN